MGNLKLVLQCHLKSQWSYIISLKMRRHFPLFPDGCLKRLGDVDSPISVYRKQFIWYNFKWYFICKWHLEKSFWLERENIITPKHLNLCPLCLMLTCEGRTNTWWWLNYHCLQISFFKSSFLFQSCYAIYIDSTEAVPILWLWLTVILQEI